MKIQCYSMMGIFGDSKRYRFEILPPDGNIAWTTSMIEIFLIKLIVLQYLLLQYFIVLIVSCQMHFRDYLY